MKKFSYFRKLLITLVLFALTFTLQADPPNPPNPGGDPGGGGGVPVGAPLDESTWVLIILGVIFGVYQVYQQFLFHEKHTGNVKEIKS